jgi:maltooligosyltrehalose synthase
MPKHYEDEKEPELMEEAPEEEQAPEPEAVEEEAPAEPKAEAEPEAEEEAPEESLSDKVSALEDRIAVLEAQLEQAEKDTEEAEKAGDALRSELETYRLAALQAKKSQRTEFLEVLAASSAALNQPISARDLALVESRFSAGDDEGARAIGEAFLARAQALSTASGSGELRKLGPDKLDGKRATVEQTARYLRHGGLDFDLAEDGTRIINKRRRSR